jgi:hypothetical protein
MWRVTFMDADLYRKNSGQIFHLCSSRAPHIKTLFIYGCRFVPQKWWSNILPAPIRPGAHTPHGSRPFNHINHNRPGKAHSLRLERGELRGGLPFFDDLVRQHFPFSCLGSALPFFVSWLFPPPSQSTLPAPSTPPTNAALGMEGLGFRVPPTNAALGMEGLGVRVKGF